MLRYVLSLLLVSVSCSGYVFVNADSGDNQELEYFQLILPSQEQILIEKEISSDYVADEAMIQEIAKKKEVIRKQSVALVLPAYIQPPLFLPETGAVVVSHR